MKADVVVSSKHLDQLPDHPRLNGMAALKETPVGDFWWCQLVEFKFAQAARVF